MTIRRHLRLLAGCAALAFLLAIAGNANSQLAPNSIGLLYFDKKHFKEGDWVLYKMLGSDLSGVESVDYQKVVIAAEVDYRGEDCFWLETGWGPSPEQLAFSTILVSELIFKEDNPTVRHSVYMRKMHMGEDDNGVPFAIDVRLANPGRAIPNQDHLKPIIEEIGIDTLEVDGKTLVCRVLEETQVYPRMRDLPDSTMRLITRVKRTRWVSMDIPITAIVKEIERRERYRQAWPIGRPSTDYPEILTEAFDIEIEAVKWGTGAKPMVSHLIKDSAIPSTE